MIVLNGDVVFWIFFTIISYLFCLRVYSKFKKAWLNPLYTASLLLISILLIFHVQEGAYKDGSVIFNHLLKLAVVSLAVPLYKQWRFIKQNYQKIFTGVFGGTVMGVLSAVGLAQLFHLNQPLIASLVPKSVTLPIAITISNDLGGISSVTVCFVIISSLMSLTIGPNLFKRFGIKSKGARGLAMGLSAQMLGANRSLHWGEEEGAMGNVGMIASALFLSILIPILPFILKI
jgi:predicted murein hydrolase (TIGR00659 family)